MDALERPNYYAVIPAEVRYSPDISASEKLLYGEIASLTNKNGTCWASNAYFASLYGVADTVVSRWVKHLVAAGFVTSEVVAEAGNKRYIKLAGGVLTKSARPLDEKVKNNNKTNKVTKVTYSAQPDEVLQAFNSFWGRNIKVAPKSLEKTARTFTLGEIKAAWSALKADSWHAEAMKERPFSPDYLMRADTVDNFKDRAGSVREREIAKQKAQFAADAAARRAEKEQQ